MTFFSSMTKLVAFSAVLFFSVFNSFAQSNIYRLPIGTKIRLKMDNEINSRVSSKNDTFTATLAEPVVVNGTEIVALGSNVEGTITNVKAATLGKVNGVLEVRLEKLKIDDATTLQIDASISNFSLFETKRSSFSAISILGGTALGAVLGGITGRGSGAAIGAGIGAGAGTAAAFLRKGKEARIKANDKFEIRLNKELLVPAKDF